MPNPRLGVRIREARAADALGLASVQQRSSLKAYASIFPAEAPKPTRQALAKGWRAAAEASAALLAESGEGTIGGVIAQDAELSRLYVDPQWWRRGVGRRLYDSALLRIRDAGKREAFLWVLEENHGVRAMYERRGWQLIRGETNEVYPGVVEVRYRLLLEG